MMKTISHHRDYSFEEWNNLPLEVKRDIWNNYWNPYKPDIGKLTKDVIIEEFKRAYPQIAEKILGIGYGYFGWSVGCIYIIVSDSSLKVPKEFASIVVNKGTIEKQVDKETILVNWRYGGSHATFKLSE